MKLCREFEVGATVLLEHLSQLLKVRLINLSLVLEVVVAEEVALLV
jgi:hypothetical protein